MQVANDDTVLGDFSDVTFEYFDTTTSLFRKDGAFMVETENARGEQQAFRITHTFGVEPLQQYLVDMPDGRKQSLAITWDARPAADGGQRWYHLYPDEYVGPGDPLHWTGQYFTWNTACAECHSTNLQLGYDIESDTFNTTFDEISVGCEACHGPGSSHIEQADTKQFDEAYGLSVDLDDRGTAAWLMNAVTGVAERSAPNLHKQQPEACGRCHSRRSVLTEDYEYGKPLTDTYMVSLLEENLYHADGRILDEVYVYGSFVQSKMYAAGVTCSDCHEPHSARLRTGPEPNAICSTCHLPARFAADEHAGVNSSQCVDCHMQAETYMGVDDRRDHSFRVPGTEASASHYGNAIAAGRAGNANDQLLAAISNEDYPPIARATLLSLISPPAGSAEMDAIKRSFADPDPLVRIGALRALSSIPDGVRGVRGSHLLKDPVRGVRIEASLAFLDLRDLLPLEDARAFANAAQEYRDSMLVSASLPDAAVNLAGFESRLGNDAAAARLYEHAIRIGEHVAAVQNAYGLYKVRTGDPDTAVLHLQRATQIDPNTPWFSYVYGVSLNSTGSPDKAIRVLGDARDKFPENFDIAWALVTMYRDAGDRTAAEGLLAELQEQFPGNAQLAALAETLR